MYLSMNINVLYDSSLHALYSEVSTTTSNVGTIDKSLFFIKHRKYSNNMYIILNNSHKNVKL